MNDSAIKISELTKIYHLYNRPQDRLKEVLHPFRKSYHHDYYALQDVSLDIKKGETVGIIGKNGAGKSTLLKIITGVLHASSGTVKSNGKIASLLELGAGFNPEMTGMENIFLNGTIMGYSRNEMEERMDAILEFADIGEFIFQPVKMYSSGMFARLAFAVAINVEPDILIVDEALSVGDMAFQMKCFKKFESFQALGKTILFVTHALDSVIRHCNRCIVIDDGKLVFDNKPKLAVDAFKKILSGNFYVSEKENKDKTQLKNDEVVILKDSFKKHKEIDLYGNGKATIIDYGLLDDNDKPSELIDYNSEFKIVMKVEFCESVAEPIFAFTLKDAKGLEITGTNTSMKYITTGTCDTGQIVNVVFTQKANLQIGAYALSLGCVNLNEDGIEVHSRIYNAILFEVIGAAQMVGFYDLESDIALEVTGN